MDQTTLSIIVAVILCDIVIVMLVMGRKKAKRKQLQALLAATAEVEGWTVIPTPEKDAALHVTGTIAPGIAWELIVRQSRKSAEDESNRSTVWRTADVRMESGIIAIGPGVPLSLADVDLAHPLVRRSLQRLYGKETADALAEAAAIDTGDPAFTRLYMVLSNDEAAARQFVRDPVPSMLLDWRSSGMPPPTVSITQDGMHVRFLNSITDIDTLRKIVMLCGALAVRGKEVGREQLRA